MKNIYIALVIIFSSCQKYEVEDKFVDHVDTFIFEMESRGVNLVFPSNFEVTTRDMDGFDGLCRHKSRYKKIIYIDDSYDEWELARQELTVFHELGHCVMGKGHVTNTDFAIMSINLNISVYRDNREKLLDDLAR